MALFPYFEQDNLRRGLIDNVANPHFQNCIGPNSVGAQVVKILICPSDGSMPNPPVGTYLNQYYFGLSSYGGWSGAAAPTTNGHHTVKNGIVVMKQHACVT